MEDSSDRPGPVDNALPAASNHGQLDRGRRAFVRDGGRLLVYSAPLIQLFRPDEARAGSAMSAT